MQLPEAKYVSVCEQGNCIHPLVFKKLKTILLIPLILLILLILSISNKVTLGPGDVDDILWDCASAGLAGQRPPHPGPLPGREKEGDG